MGVGTAWLLCLLADDESVAARSAEELREHLQAARPGTRVLVAPGEHGGIAIEGVRGAEGEPIVVAPLDPKSPPVFTQGVQFSKVAHLELEGLVFAGAAGNGLNIDDGGELARPSHHVVLRGLVVRDCGGEGNDDGIKLSGVSDFRVERCTVERWGRGGSAIDMVGCARGEIVDCTIRDSEVQPAANGVQMKGGSRGIAVRDCRFEHAGQRAVNLGGSTGLAYFRPRPEGFEARDVLVEGCTFIGSTAPIAFVGVDGATVRFNTFHRPRKWLMRILQETRGPEFAPCRNGRFTDNLVVYRADEMRIAVNVGPDTAPETFEFARNYWYCEDDGESPRPELPTAERDGAGGADPMLRDAAMGDLRVAASSPARGHGAHARPARR